jgi:Ca-activated chloride channel family protein
MKMSLNVDRKLYGPAGGHRYLWTRIEVPRTSQPVERSPLDISLVIDRSGSMGGNKIELARRAAAQAVGLLRETDRCGVIAYDNEVIRAAPCLSVDAGHRAALVRAIGAIYARGNTDLFGGWLAGAEDVSATDSGRISRVLLLTDGLANEGITDPDEILRHVRALSLRGVGTSAFGIGLDFDEVLVSGIAEAGNGHFYYIERPEQIQDYLSSEIGELLRVAARNATLSVVATGGAAIENLNGLPFAKAVFQLGDLSENDVLDLHFLIKVPSAPASAVDVQVKLAWTDALNGKKLRLDGSVSLVATDETAARAEAPDKEVIAQVVRTRIAQTRSEALALNRAGMYDASEKRVADEIRELASLADLDPDLQDEVAALEGQRGAFKMAMPSAAAKSMTFESYLTRRSRRDPNS